MNQDLQNLEIKVENEGTTPQGRLTAAEWNILVAAVKSLDLTGGSVDVTSILQAVADAGYTTQEWVNNQNYVTATDFNKFVKDFVTLNTEQAISGIKDFTNGLKVGGLSVYKSQDDTIYLDCNLVVRGGITAFGTNKTITASIFEALPIDGTTIKRDPITKELYVDTTVVGGGGSGGGISIADVENYLTTNGYATQSWVTGKGYFLASNFTKANIKSTLGISDWALASAKPTYAYSEISGTPTSLKNPNALSWSGYSSGSYDGSTAQSIALPTKLSQLTDDVVSRKYLSLAGGTLSGNVIISTSGWVNQLVLNGINSNAGIQFKYSDSLVGTLFCAQNHPYWATVSDAYNILHSGNYSDYALPKDGTAVAANRLIEEVVTDLNNATVGRIFTMTSGYGSTAGNKPTTRWVTGLTLQYAQNSAYRRQLVYSDVDLYIRDESNGIWGDWRKILTSTNFYDYAMPITGGTVNGSVQATSFSASEWMSSLFFTSNSSRVGVNTIGVCRWGTFDEVGGLKIQFGEDSDTKIEVVNRQWSKGLFSIDTSGNVTTAGTMAIGGTTASEKLHVYGNILATGGITATNSSDERLKKNIRKFNASKTLMSLGAVWEYEYIDSEVQKNHIYEGTHYGLIYQHVKGTKLDVMCHTREDGMGALNYIHPKFISLIAGATMENISEVEKLKRKIRHLEAKVKQLEKRA